MEENRIQFFISNDGKYFLSFSGCNRTLKNIVIFLENDFPIKIVQIHIIFHERNKALKSYNTTIYLERTTCEFLHFYADALHFILLTVKQIIVKL